LRSRATLTTTKAGLAFAEKASRVDKKHARAEEFSYDKDPLALATSHETQENGRQRIKAYLKVCNCHDIDSPAMREFEQTIFYPFH
jgi:hypothetical protein